MLSKDEILNSSDVKISKVFIPEKNGDVYLRSMSAKDSELLQTDLENNESNVRAKVLVRSLCDAEGKRILDDEDADSLGEQPNSVIQFLFQEALKLSQVDESAKNIRS